MTMVEQRIRIIAFLLMAFTALGLSYAPSASAEDAKSVTLIVENHTPNFEVIPTVEGIGANIGVPQPFNKISDGVYQFSFSVQPDHWFNDASIKLVWKNDYLRPDNTMGDFEQRIVLRIRQDFPTSYTVPVFFSNDRTGSEILRLENERDKHDQFETFFRSWQIAQFYRETLGERSKYANRASHRLFFAAVDLAEQPQYFVEMSDDAVRFVEEATGDTTSWKQRANAAKALYWADLPLVGDFVNKNDCTKARELLAEFRSLKSNEPIYYGIHFAAQTGILDDVGKIVGAKCPG